LVDNAAKRMAEGKSGRRKLPKKFPAHETIRVVPLHHPQFQRAVTAKLTYRGGALIEAAKVFTIFWGQSWADDADAKALAAAVNQFFSDILVSSLIDQLSEYNSSGKTIGHGSSIGSAVVTADAPINSVTDSKIQTALQNWISNGTAPLNDKDTIYFVYLEQGIVSVMGGSRSCQSYCGYHNNVNSIYYAVMPYPGCSGCLGGLAVLDALTGTSSHELCEAITDPVPGTGWYDDTQGEIGDICAWQFKQVDGYTVQLEWSNEQNKCV
jgi:hypothetical protein